MSFNSGHPPHSYTSSRIAGALTIWVLFLFYLWNCTSLIKSTVDDPGPGHFLAAIAYYSLFLLLITAIMILFFRLVSGRIGNGKVISAFYMCVCSLWLIMGVIDQKIFQIMGFHLYDPYVRKSLMTSGVGREIRLSWSTQISLIVFSGTAVLLPFMFRRWKTLMERAEAFRWKWVLTGLPLLAGSVLFFYRAELSELEEGLPVLKETGLLTSKFVEVESVVIKEDAEKNRSDYYQAYIDSGRFGINRKNILLIAVESFRWDVIQPEIAPFLCSLSDSFNTIRSDHHFSGSHITETGMFSIFFGLHSFQYKNFCDNLLPPLGLRWLRNAGYRTTGLSASALSEWHGGVIMVGQLDEYKEFIQGDPVNNDRQVVAEAARIYRDRDTSRPFMHFVFLNATHHNYSFPEDQAKFRPFMDAGYNHFLGDDKLEVHREEIFNRYKNSAAFVDQSIKDLLKVYEKEIRAGQLAVIITGDHGEEFWDNGFLGHGAPNLYSSRTRVPLIFYLPGMEPIHQPFSSHTDLMPTLMQYIFPERQPVSDRLMFGRSLLMPFEAEDMAVISASQFESRRKLCLVNSTGKYWMVFPEGEVVQVTDQWTMDDQAQPVKIDTLLRSQLRKLRGELERY